MTNEININNEKELHYKVVNYIRKYMDSPIIIPGLGEYQVNTNIRNDAYYKGYTGGQPDLIILNQHEDYNGFVLELKTPKNNGVISTNQQLYIDRLNDNRFFTLISSDYDEIITALVKYSMGLVFNKQIFTKERKTSNIKNYYKLYYSKNKEKLLKNAKTILICACGVEYQKSNRVHHLKSKNHINWVENN